MFRITTSNPAVVSAFLTRWSGLPRRVARVYRWGAAWGLHFAGAAGSAEVWIAERRTPLATDTTSFTVLEAVEPLTCAAPPVEIDDVWDEELVLKGSVLCGNSMSLVGSGEEVIALCAEVGLALPTAMKALLDEAPKGTPSIVSKAPPPHAGPQERRLPRPPRPGRPHQSSHGHGPHPPRPSGSREERPLSGHARPPAPRPEQSGPLRNGLLLTPGPVAPNLFPRASGPPRPGQAHGGPGPRHGGWNPRGPRPFGGAPRATQERQSPQLLTKV